MPQWIQVWGPWALLTVVIWVAVLLTRKYLPLGWNVVAFLWLRDRLIAAYPDLKTWLPQAWHVVQGLPSILVGALYGAYLTGQNPRDQWLGVLFGAGAPLLHHLLKILGRPPALTLLALCLLGCASQQRPGIDQALTTKQVLVGAEAACRLYRVFPNQIPRDATAEALCPYLLHEVGCAPEPAPPPALPAPAPPATGSAYNPDAGTPAGEPEA